MRWFDFVKMAWQKCHSSRSFCTHRIRPQSGCESGNDYSSHPDPPQFLSHSKVSPLVSQISFLKMRGIAPTWSSLRQHWPVNYRVLSSSGVGEWVSLKIHHTFGINKYHLPIVCLKPCLVLLIRLLLYLRRFKTTSQMSASVGRMTSSSKLLFSRLIPLPDSNT